MTSLTGEISNPMDEYRLPLNVKPIHYALTVRTDLEKLAYDGLVSIYLDVREEASAIVLNAAELEIGETLVHSGSESQGGDQVIPPPTFDTGTERATFKIPSPLPAGSKARLQIAFRGKLSSSMIGYYKSSWEHKGTRKYYALTQFQATAARRAFPCWDEPALKATFAITLISRSDTVNLSNMPITSEKRFPLDSDDDAENLSKFVSTSITEGTPPTDNWKITRFETSPPASRPTFPASRLGSSTLLFLQMSSYLVAYANGHFDYLESSYKSPISGKTRPLRVYATSDIIHQAQFTLDIKARVLPLYEQIFDIEYPLPKLDTLIANDFDAGAMENWGLITGRTSAFLLDPKSADLVAKKYVTNIQCHEVAHMWFGDITTMEWWNYLYLNEGFATMVGEMIMADRIFPEWKVDSEFITEHLNNALGLDARLSSHPVEVDCPDANRIGQIFDLLSYSKAASVLRMLSNYVGEARFLKGVSIYLKNHLYGNTVTTDLWEGIREATGIDITAVMKNWITKVGFPVLTVTEGPNGILVSQNRFVETGLPEAEDNETIWTIPLSILTVNGNGEVTVHKTAILDEKEQLFAIDPSLPFKLNAGTVGFYRVLYTSERLSKIAAEAAKDNSCFSLNDRMGLVYDLMALAKAGLAKVSSGLTLMNILRHNEREYLVWNSMSGSLDQLVSTWWEQPRVVDLLNGFRRELYVPLVEKLGYEYSDADAVDTTLLRTLAISGAANAQDTGVIKELRSRFAHFVNTADDSKIPADLQDAIFSVAVRHGGREEYEAVKRICENPKTPSSRIAAMQGLRKAMCATEDPILIAETIDYTLTKARDQNVRYLFIGLQLNFKTRRVVSQMFKDNYDTICTRFEENFNFRFLVEFSFGHFCKWEDYHETVEFFKDKDTSKYDLALSQTLEGMKTNIGYVERSSQDLLEWLVT